MAPGHLRKPPQAPPVFTATTQSLIDDAKRLIETSRKVQDDVVARVTPETASFESVMKPLAQDENVMALESHILGFYQAVSTEQQLRDASSKAEELMDEFFIETVMREDVFKLVEAALKKGEKLEPESRRLLEKEHKDYIRNGLGLPAVPSGTVSRRLRRG